MDASSQHLEGNGNDKSNGSCAATLFRQASKWIQQQKPVLMAFHAASLQVRDIIVHRFQHTWPIVCTWLLRLGRLFLILFILWLDCCLRGMDSFLQWWMSILLCGYLVQLSYLHFNGNYFQCSSKSGKFSYPTITILMEVFFAYETYQKHYWPYLVIYVYDLIGWEV